MRKDLPRSAAAAQGVDPAAVLAFVDAVEADPAIELHSLMVVSHGQVVAEGWWAPHTAERPRLLYSVSKSFTSAALGFALAEGRVGLDDTVLSHFPELDGEITDRRSRSVTLRQVASMASGHDRDLLDEVLAADPREPVRGFLLIAPDQEPGTIFAYSQPCAYALAAVIQRAVGMRLSEYLRPRLFDPLGIGEVGWLEWPPGREQGFSGLFARTEDVAKFGQLFLQGGRWDEDQLLPEAYVEQATSRLIGTPNQNNVDWRQGYGFGFWMARHGYRADGAFGQFAVVLPEHDAVVAITGGTEATQGVVDNLWEHLLPGLGGGRPGDAAQRDLDKRLGDLRLPACVARPGPPRWEDWTGRPFAVAPGAEGVTAPLTSVELHRADAGLEVTVAEPANALTFPVGAGDWRVSAPPDGHGDPVPVAASGGWPDDHTARVEVVFLESPHRLDITCSLPARTAEAAWRGVPMDGGRLRTLHRPR